MVSRFDCVSRQISGDNTGGVAVQGQYSSSIVALFAFKLIPTESKRKAERGKS